MPLNVRHALSRNRGVFACLRRMATSQGRRSARELGEEAPGEGEGVRHGAILSIDKYKFNRYM